MTTMRRTAARFSCAAAVFALGLLACGADGTQAGPNGLLGAPGAANYDGLRGQQVACPSGATTTVSGVVYAPNGRLPLYNAIVYVPGAQPTALQKGATCEPCGAVTGSPIVAAISAADGRFSLANVPAGKNIPLVIQIGKWRRMVVLPEVVACRDNPITNPELTRLPRNQREGDIPRIALTTGGCDQLGCLLPKIGLDPAEFGVAQEGSAKSVHVYRGANAEASYDGGPTVPASGPSNAPPAQGLWSNAAALRYYDMAILSCECAEVLENKGPTANAAMADYLRSGGRIFTTDFMYTWYRDSADPGLRSFASITGEAPEAMSPLVIDQSFPKGQALASWLDRVAHVPGGQVPAQEVYANLAGMNPAKAQAWASSSGTPNGPRVFTVNVPVDAPPAQQCGKGVHIDAHVNTPSSDEVTNLAGDVIDERYPAGCSPSLLPTEHLLAFFFFDLAACIQSETAAPRPPAVIK